MQIRKLDTSAIQDMNHRRFMEDLYKIFKGNISFGQQIGSGDQNIEGTMVNVANTGAINTEFVVVHNLGRVPLFFDVKYRNIACSIYDSGTVWTVNKAFFKCDQANAHVRLFIH